MIIFKFVEPFSENDFIQIHFICKVKTKITERTNKKVDNRYNKFTHIFGDRRRVFGKSDGNFCFADGEREETILKPIRRWL